MDSDTSSFLVSEYVNLFAGESSYSHSQRASEFPIVLTSEDSTAYILASEQTKVLLDSEHTSSVLKENDAVSELSSSVLASELSDSVDPSCVTSIAPSLAFNSTANVVKYVKLVPKDQEFVQDQEEAEDPGIISRLVTNAVEYYGPTGLYKVYYRLPKYPSKRTPKPVSGLLPGPAGPDVILGPVIGLVTPTTARYENTMNQLFHKKCSLLQSHMFSLLT